MVLHSLSAWLVHPGVVSCLHSLPGGVLLPSARLVCPGGRCVPPLDRSILRVFLPEFLCLSGSVQLCSRLFFCPNWFQLGGLLPLSPLLRWGLWRGDVGGIHYPPATDLAGGHTEQLTCAVRKNLVTSRPRRTHRISSSTVFRKCNSEKSLHRRHSSIGKRASRQKRVFWFQSSIASNALD